MRYLLLIAVLFLALPAHAIKVVNLDKVPHVLVVNNGGEVSEVTLEPNRSYTTFGPMVDLGVKSKAKIKVKMLRADPFSDYAIWAEGKLTIQIRRESKLR